ncbi:molybdenum transporter permease ModB [Salmonella enterica subsp. enterica]|nr:molybdenum transporter permease ModB [Salmonella enterica subsp. enterica] [Salmonella enterica subsp. enterica serovar Menston]
MPVSGKALLDSVLHLPLVLPPVVVGYLLLVSMGRRGFIGQWLYDWFGLTFAFSWRGAVLAAAVMSFPLMVRAIRLALEGVDIKLEQAARTLGAGRWRVFLTITLPLTLPGIIVGTVLAFARSLGEFGRDHYLCFQYSGRNPHHTFRYVYLDSDAWRGERGGEAVRDFDCISADFAINF